MKALYPYALILPLLKYGGDIAVGAMTILPVSCSLQCFLLQGIAQERSQLQAIIMEQTIRNVKDFSCFINSKSDLFCHTLAGCNAFATILCEHFYSGDSDDRVRIKKALRIYMAVMFLFGIQIACQMTFTALGNATSSIIVAVTRKFILGVTIDLYYATYGFKQNHGCLPCRAGSRFHSSNLYCNFVLFPV